MTQQEEIAELYNKKIFKGKNKVQCKTCGWMPMRLVYEEKDYRKGLGISYYYFTCPKCGIKRKIGINCVKEIWIDVDSRQI
jgi:hypothetical protein